MSKYSYEFKKKVVMSYLNGEGGYTYLANFYNIPSKHVSENGLLHIRNSEMRDYFALDSKQNTLSKRSYLL